MAASLVLKHRRSYHSVYACSFCLKHRHFPQAHALSPYLLCQLKSIQLQKQLYLTPCLLLAEHPGAHFLLLSTVGLAAPEAIISCLQEWRNTISILKSSEGDFLLQSCRPASKSSPVSLVLELAQASGFDKEAATSDLHQMQSCQVNLAVRGSCTELNVLKLMMTGLHPAAGQCFHKDIKETLLLRKQNKQTTTITTNKNSNKTLKAN